MAEPQPRDPPVEGLRCRWCREPAMAEAAASFFVAHADPAYISHSELQFGRAVAPDRWAEDLGTMIRAQAAHAIALADQEPELTGTRLAVLTEGGALRGIGFVTFDGTARQPFATLDDLLVDSAARGAGLGLAMLDWVSGQCRAGGFSRLFLESGTTNERAHRFFARQGFVRTSVVMMRTL